MKGVILAAGKGSRLYPVTHHIAKPLLPLANRVTMYYAFDRLKEIGIQEVRIVVGENEPQMRQLLGDGSAFGLKLSYVRQPDPKGLAHALGFCKAFISDEPFALYLGDSLYSEGFEKFANKFASSGAANMNIVCEVEDPRRYGVANLDGDRIVKLVEKPAVPESNWAMAGLYFFGPQIWKILPNLQPSARGEYEITDAIQALIDGGETVLAGKYRGTWFDTGTRESYLETSFFLTKGESLIDPSAKLAGIDKKPNVVGQNAEVECTSISGSIILPGAKITGDARIENCVLGGECSLVGTLTNAVRYGDEA